MNLEMKNKKYLVTHHMTYETFMYFVKKLKPFIKSKIIMFIKTPLKLWVSIMLVCS
jgi:hypothetical protein